MIICILINFIIINNLLTVNYLLINNYVLTIINFINCFLFLKIIFYQFFFFSKAKSGSRAWYVMFDYGTNYCNLRNLVDGAGLVNDQRFMELTNDAVCTQRGTATCV